MRTKDVVPSAKARRDVEDAVDYYAREAGEAVALDFVDDLQQRYRLLAAQPGIGSLRYAYELNLPGLRSLRLSRFPYVVFYVEREAVEIWRVLHGSRDTPSWIEAGDEA